MTTDSDDEPGAEPQAEPQGEPREGSQGEDSDKKSGSAATDRPARPFTGPKDKSAWSADLALVRKTLEGDSDAVDKILQRMVCIPRFLHRANQRAGHPVDAHGLDDLSQEISARVWRDRERFEGHSKLESWIFGYASRVFMEAIGANRVRVGHEGTPKSVSLDRPDDATPVDEYVERKIDAKTILDAVDALPERERMVIRMKLLDGMSFTEIARHTGDDVNALKTRYYRAIQGIRGKFRASDAGSSSKTSGSETNGSETSSSETSSSETSSSETSSSEIREERR